MASLRADVDRLRDRARSVATLLATAAGALIAGLVFSSVGQALPTSTKVAGYTGVGILAVSVCCFLAASLYRLKPDENPAPANQSVEDVVKASAANAKAAATEISRRTDLGKWLGLVGLFLFFVMLPIGVAYPDARIPVSVQVLSPDSADGQTCPLTATPIDAHVERADLAGSSTLITLIVPGDRCGEESGSEIHLTLERSKTVIAVKGAH